MFTLVFYRVGFIALLSALFLLLTIPFTAESQAPTEATTTASTSLATQTPPAAGSLFGLYQSEGVPGGGDAIGDFVVGPGKADITIAPGESKTVEMLVTNRTGEPRRFNITVEDAMGSQDTDTSIVLLGDDRGPYSMKDYVSVPHTSFDLNHNERAHIPVTITIPADAEPGGLYGSVLIDTIAIDAQGGIIGGSAPQSAIIARIGTLFFITIPGSVEKDGNLKDITTLPPQRFYQTSPITFGLLYENRGSIHLVPYGELRIRNIFNEEVGFLELDPWFVLPESLRLREVTWERDFLFGRYTATAYINRSYDDVIDEMSFTFWVLPWKPLAVVFLVLFFTFFILRTFLKKFELKRKA